MRVLQVLHLYYPAERHGGITVWVRELASGLVERGHEVTVLCTNLVAPDQRMKGGTKQSCVDGVPVLYLMTYRLGLGQGSRGITFPPEVFSSSVRQRLSEFDVVHIHGYRSGLASGVSYVADQERVPYVLQAHGSLRVVSGAKALKRVFDLVTGRRMISRASKVVSVSHSETEQYLKLGAESDQVKLVPYGLPREQFEDLPERGGFRAQYGIEQDERLLVFLGRLHPTKRLGLLVDSFAEADVASARLAIVGPDDGSKEHLRDQIKRLGLGDRVLLPGSIYGAEKLSVLVDADATVRSSSIEGFPVAIIESIACGTPVIVTDECGVTQEVHGNFGLSARGTVEALSRAIRRLLMDDSLRSSLGRRGREAFRKSFSRDVIIERLIKLYQDVS